MLAALPVLVGLIDVIILALGFLTSVGVTLLLARSFFARIEKIRGVNQPLFPTGT